MTRKNFLHVLPKLVNKYVPAQDVLDRLKDISLVMVIGPSGVGKTSIINKLGLHYVASDTTRNPRPEEKDGVDYHFRNDYDDVLQQIKNGQFVQVAVGPTGDLYATRGSSYPASGLAVMAVVADAVPVFRNDGFKQTISLFITPPSYAEWMQRLGSHDLNKEQLAKRLAEASRSLRFALHDEEMHFVLNDDIDKAVEQAQDIITGKTNKQRENQARQIAESLLNKVDL